MTCVLDILSLEELYRRKNNLLKQLEKVNNEITKKESILKNDNINNQINELKQIDELNKIDEQNEIDEKNQIDETNKKDEQNKINQIEETKENTEIGIQKIKKNTIRIKIKKI